MRAKDFDYLLLCKDKNDIVRQVLTTKDQILLLFEHQQTVLGKTIKVIEDPVEGITWSKQIKKKINS